MVSTTVCDVTSLTFPWTSNHRMEEKDARRMFNQFIRSLGKVKSKRRRKAIKAEFVRALNEAYANGFSAGRDESPYDNW